MTEIATIYGGALYDLAAGENLSLEILGQLKVLQSCFETEPTFAKLLSAYHVPKAERCKIIDDSFTGKVHPYVMNFLKILTEKGYVRHFSDCCEAYCVRYNQANNILPVTAVTAVAMDAGQQERLLKKLEDLNVSFNAISSLKPLAECTVLKELKADNITTHVKNRKIFFISVYFNKLIIFFVQILYIAIRVKSILKIKNRRI